MDPYSSLNLMLALPENQDIVLVVRDSQSPVTTERLSWELLRTAWAGRADEVPASFAQAGEFLDLYTDDEYLYVRGAARWQRIPFENSTWEDDYTRLLRPVLPSLASAPVDAPNGYGYYDTVLEAVRFKQGDALVSLQPPQAFSAFVSGATTLNADENGTFKFRSSDDSVLLTLTNNDVTHGDNLNIRVDPTAINVGDFVDDNTYALAAHNHTGVYSPVGHNHDDLYAALAHNHTGVYSLIDHNHTGVYALFSHEHAASALTSGTLDNARVAAGNVTQHQAAINHDALLNYSANRHIDHSAVSILTASGSGLAGGGTLESSRSLVLDIVNITETTVVDHANDFLVLYDASAGANRKVHSSYLGFSLVGHEHSASQVTSGILAADRGGLGANAAAFSGLIKIVGGVASVATPGVDYAAPSGAAHTQNTDTGTTSAYFQLLTGGSGGRIYWDTSEFRLRTADNSAYASLRVKELFVEGAVTTIVSNQIELGDNILLLNQDITTAAGNSDAGLDVKLLAADNTTRRDVAFRYNTTLRRWTGSGFTATTEAPVTKTFAQKHEELIGDAAEVTFVVEHGLHTEAVVVAVIEVSTGEMVLVDWEVTDEDSITITFGATVPGVNAFRVVVVG